MLFISQNMTTTTTTNSNYMLYLNETIKMIQKLDFKNRIQLKNATSVGGIHEPNAEENHTADMVDGGSCGPQ